MRKGFAGSLGNSSSGLPAEAAISQAPDDATATATAVSSSISSASPRTLTSGVAQNLSTHSDELQAALDNHQEDTFYLLQMVPASGKPTVAQKMLHKIRAVNLKTMTKANSLISRAGRGELSTCNLKQLGENAEKKAMENTRERLPLGMLWKMSSHPPSTSMSTLMHWVHPIPPLISHRVLMSSGNQLSPIDVVF